MYINVDDKLVEIQKKINKIEDDDSDFASNKKWQELRNQQDVLYELKRQEMGNDRTL